MSNNLIIENLKNKIKSCENNFIFNAKIIANAKKNSIEELPDEEYKIRVTQIPQDGKANKEIIKFLSEILDIPKSKIEIIKGELSHHKTISISKQ